ncbi:MAG TPA: gamma-glutamyl-gamma-aminobutyrate hydrolase family protein, partial [Pyrinomonadaceae bacterium]|nr:gamma-glutamyl-gamma-aminobutyrate hydrolase family protein [Pyrinomonadaceae bacterium]
MKRKPIIGLTMRLELETDRFYLGRDYSEALEALGAIPYHISLIPNKDYLSEVVKNIDGILLPGSDTDVDPLIFGEEPRPSLKKIIPEKENTDLMILAEAEKLKKNVLGICFGMQVLNVARGGTLIQDIETEIENCVKHEQGKPLARNSHSLEFENESLISRLITNKNDVRVNSHHHQAIGKVGKNLKSTAWAKDGVIECIEDTRNDRFVLGVQWHPELSWKTD